MASLPLFTPFPTKNALADGFLSSRTYVRGEIEYMLELRNSEDVHDTQVEMPKRYKAVLRAFTREVPWEELGDRGSFQGRIGCEAGEGAVGASNRHRLSIDMLDLV